MVSSAFVFITVVPFEVCLQRLRLGALVSEVAESSGAQFEGILPLVIRSKILGVKIFLLSPTLNPILTMLLSMLECRASQWLKYIWQLCDRHLM